MSERIEYVVRDKHGEEFPQVSLARAELKVREWDLNHPKDAPHVVWKLTIAATPLAPGAPETAP